MNYYQCEHFILQELVDRQTYLEYGDKAWEFFDPRALFSLDAIWDLINSYRVQKGYKPRRVYINNWYWGGDREWSGFRPCSCPVGAVCSPHRRGCAFDFIVEGLAASDVRKRILISQYTNDDLKYITRMEHLKNGTPINWVHFDSVNYDTREEGILLFNV